MFYMFTREYIESTPEYQLYRNFVLTEARLLGLAIGVALRYQKAVYGQVFGLSVDSNLTPNLMENENV